jgi:tetratricopeptide (TPR) repeat protein
MDKKYPEFDVPKRTLVNKLFQQRWSTLLIEGLIVVVAIIATVGFLTPDQSESLENADLIARLEATIAAQESALAELNANPDATQGLLELQTVKTMAWDNLSNEEYRAAIALYNVLLEEEPNDAYHYSARGFALSNIDEHALAIADYNKALELDSSLTGVYNNRCWSYAELGNYSKALEDCNTLISMRSTADYPYLNRGIVYEMMGNMDAAIVDYMYWIGLRGRHFVENDNLGYRGNVEVPMQDGHVYSFPFTVEAGRTMHLSATSTDYVIKADPLILLLDSTGMPVIANDDQGDIWDSYIEYTATATGTYTLIVTHAGGSNEGTVNVAMELSGEAVPVYSEAELKSMAYRALVATDYDQAEELFKEALRLDPRDAETLNWLGVTYRHQGEYGKALAHIGTAISFDSTYDLPYLSRGITYELMGQSSDAAMDYYQYMMRNRTRSFYHVGLEASATDFTLPMREGWVYSIPFDAVAGQVVNIDVETVAPGFVDPLIMIFDENHVPMIGDDDLGRDNFNAAITDFVIPEDGTYTLVISHAEGGANGVVNVGIDLTDPNADVAYDYNKELAFGCGGGH